MADAAPTPQELPRPRRPRFFWPGGLSARLLTLTILFVAGGGALAFPPALASFERQWLLERVRAAETVSRFADIAPTGVNDPQREQLLRGAGVEWVAIQTRDEGL
ncbi:MAG TPA: sensor histidine kinase, partial [Phenylobacterium sp.]|nr:sensor histidine kinase [Phenylobacterium sp.]